MKQKQLWISFVIFILPCFMVEIVESFWTNKTVSTWYSDLIFI